MNCKTLLFVPLVLSSGIAAATPDLSEYSIAFSDEFNGLTLDSDKWNTGYLWGPYLPINNEEQLYVDINGMHAGATHNPFELTGDSLIIRATPTTGEIQPPVRPDETDSIWDGYPEYRFNGPDAETGDPGYRPEDINYLSGLITSYESFRFTHGYAETRVKLPKGQGLWPAFWLSTSFYVEDVPEIDIMEFLGHDVETIYHTYHYFEPLNNWRQISTPSYTTQGQDFTADWHTYSVSWGPKEIVWYVDGVETRRITDDEYTIANQAMYVLANLAVGGDWPGSPDEATVFPAEYEIDYIRVYEKNPPPAITQSVLDEEYQLMFSDEFNGSSLDTDKWNTHHLWGPYWQINNELQFYPDVGDTHAGIAQSPLSFENFSDGSRGLVITAREIASNELPPLPAEDSADFDAHPEWRNNLAYNDPNYVKIPQGQEGYVAGAADAPFLPEYSSGIITTYDSFKFVNGYAEIRAKLPEGSGLWPAFWLLNGYYVDQQPEIDIIETRGENPAEAVHSYHMYQPDGTLQSDSFSTFANNGENFTDDFHTYGIAWSPGKLDWYVDGVKVGDSLTGPTVSSQVMYAIINLAVGGNFVGDVGAEAVPNEMLVDYIRIYQAGDVTPDVTPAAQGNDEQLELAVAEVLDALESYSEENGSYRVADSGWGGSGLGLFQYEGGNYTQSIAAVLIEQELLTEPVPADVRYTGPASQIDNYDFMVFTCLDRVGVFANSLAIEPLQEDLAWWQDMGCSQAPLQTHGKNYFLLSQ